MVNSASRVCRYLARRSWWNIFIVMRELAAYEFTRTQTLQNFAMTHRLLVNPGTPQAWEISLKPGVNRIGRSEQNDFQVTHASVSGAHCEIVLSSAGVVLRDLGSTNGTFVNRSPVREITLQPGQHVQLGSVDMIFEAPTQAMPVT